MAPPRTRFVVDGRLWCSACKEMRPVMSFNKSSFSAVGYQSTCKGCTNDRRSSRRLNRTPEEKAEASRKARAKMLWKNYRLTPEEYDELFEFQGGKCAISICKNVVARIDNDTLHVDHNHSTEKVRGLLCASCNTGLGNMKDSVDMLHAGVDFLIDPPMDRLLKLKAEKENAEDQANAA